MNGRDITALGYREGPVVGLALKIAKRARKRMSEEDVLKTLSAVRDAPEQWASDPVWGELAAAIVEERDRPYWVEREAPAPYQVWGEGLEGGAIQQMANAVRLPVAVSGALMPDAHVGYGSTIGGVLATENAVIPYAVGVDIACRMKMSVFDRNGNTLAGQRDRLANFLESETRFGIGAHFKERRHHDVMDEDWSVSPVTQQLRDKAWKQLGTSGSGNHFVEFGIFTPTSDDAGIPPGEYLALLSHSGSRGTGAQVCAHYSRIAMERHKELPKELKHLSWLSLDEAEG